MKRLCFSERASLYQWQVCDTDNKQRIPLAGITTDELVSYLAGGKLPPHCQEAFDQIDKDELATKLLTHQLKS